VAELADLGILASELRPMVERLELRRNEAAAVRADLEARESALERRTVEVGRTELALQARLDELNQLERDLRSELEEREHELERRRITLDEQLRAARRTPTDTPTPPPVKWSEDDRIVAAWSDSSGS
jgi:septal ring factor EnvC (AmiA/AmiB activator)